MILFFVILTNVCEYKTLRWGFLWYIAVCCILACMLSMSASTLGKNPLFLAYILWLTVRAQAFRLTWCLSWQCLNLIMLSGIRSTPRLYGLPISSASSRSLLLNSVERLINYLCYFVQSFKRRMNIVNG